MYDNEIETLKMQMSDLFKKLRSDSDAITAALKNDWADEVSNLKQSHAAELKRLN